MTSGNVIDRVLPMFLEGGVLHRRYQPPEEDAFEEIVPGGVWQVPVFAPRSETAHLCRVYMLDTTEAPLLCAHWRNETRTLLRLSHQKHRSLPYLHEARLRLSHDLGYLILDDPGMPLAADHPLRETMLGDRSVALQRFLSLVEAISLLHRERMLHRSIAPETVCALEHEGADAVIDGFQLSGFVTAWIRGLSRDKEDRTFLPSNPRDRAYLAPERLEALFGRPRRRLESYATDVFSLGMIGAFWFLGFDDTIDGSIAFQGPQYDEHRHRDFVDDVHARLRRSDVPSPLARLLETMTAFHAGNRPPSAQAVYDELCRIYGSVLAALDQMSGKTTSERMRFLYLQESMDKLYDDGLASTPPGTPEALAEYSELVEQDLDGGVLTWSPRGYEPWELKADKSKARKARIVALGKKYAYFCVYLDEGRSTEDRRAILVKHMLPVSRAKALRLQPMQRALPPIEPRFIKEGVSLSRRRRAADSPSWEPFVESVEFIEQDSASRPLVDFSRWLLRTLRAELLVHDYPCTIVESLPGRLVIRARGNVEEDWHDESDHAPFVRLWIRCAPPKPMADHFESEWQRDLERGTECTFSLRKDRNDDESLKLRFAEKLDDWSARFEHVSSAGWKKGDEGYIRKVHRAAHRVISRQEQAVELVAARYHHLGAQLLAPGGISIPEEHRYSPAGVDDETIDLIQRILDIWPFFALHGPPGTGKSFVARNVIAGVLETDPYARVLVAAQSHHALDNLLESVVAELEAPRVEYAEDPNSPATRPVVLRLASQRTREKVGSLARPYLPGSALKAVLADIESPPGTEDKAHTQKRSPSPQDKARKSLRKQWRKQARDRALDLDISQRLRRSASVVFSTCAGATPVALGAVGGPAAFDWVIIEEAARGWVTEMLVPMVNGTRWLLLGDHRQLPAFDMTTVKKLLEFDIAQNVTEPATEMAVSTSWRPLLNYFGNVSEAQTPPGRVEARDRLRVQRRMHPVISKMVSRAYYSDDELQPHDCTRRLHGLSKPDVLARRPLLWLDTGVYGSAAYEKKLRNPCEARLIRYAILHHNLRFPTHENGIPPVVFLSPYTRQVDYLKEQLKVPKDTIHTVDSYQGRQAEVVIISLVRNNSLEQESKAIGFLAEPERVNVMFSRARRLLIIVGSLEHFSRFSDTHWGSVIDHVKESDAVVDPRTLGFKWRP